MERGTQTESGGYTGPYRGLGIPTGVPLPAVGPPRRHMVLVTACAGSVSEDGHTAPADAACATTNTLLIPARV